MKRLLVLLVSASFATAGFACNIGHADATSAEAAKPAATAKQTPKKGAKKAVKPQVAAKAAPAEGSVPR